MNETTPEQDILQDEMLAYQYEEAGKGQRLANYIIDFILFYAIIFVTAFAAAAFIPGAAEWLERVGETPAIMDRLFTLVAYGLYMSLVEGIFKGRSLGKLITKTVAVTEHGEQLSFEKAFFRGLVRMVPFDQLSALGVRPWHDSWTKTRVVKLRNY